MSTRSDKYLTKLDRNNTNFTLQLFEHFKKTKWEQKYGFLKYYQNIVRSFVNDVDIDSRGLLIYQTMGLGKSILAISIAMDLMKERQPIILLTKSLQENMRGAIRKYVKLRKEMEPDYHLGRLSEMELDAWIDKNYSFVSMNASNMLKQMGKAAEGHSADEFDAALEKKFGEILKLASLDNKLLIVDEAHNLFRAITNGSKNAQGLYDLVMKAKNLKIMFFTGTPVANDPFELVPAFNMLGSNRDVITLPENYKEFNKLFVDEKNGKIKNKERFQNRIFGLVSYVSHHSTPGKALGVDDSTTKAEFPKENPVIVERVPMDPDQFVMYGLARDKEKEEGNTGKFGGPGNRISEPPSMTKPKSKAASTYRVKSRQLSNFCAPTGLRDEKDPNKIPTNSLGSAKYRRMYDNINKRKNQLGIVYSQFVGVGGLGTFSRYLNMNGWERIEINIKKKKPVDAINDLEDSLPGEQGELDEYVESESVPTSEIIDDKIGGADGPGADGPGVPPTSVFLTEMEAEMAHLPNETWWLRGDDTSDNLRSGGDEEIHHQYHQNNFHQVVGGINDTDDMDDMDDMVDMDDDKFTLDDALIDENTIHNTEITFKYATPNDVPAIKEINPKYIYAEDMTYPSYILLILENGKPTGYARIEYEIREDKLGNTTAVTCSGKMTESHFNNISEKFGRDVMKKLVDDAVNCRDNTQAWMKTIWGGFADTRGALPSARPDRKRFYAIISGAVAVEDRSKIQDMFNSEANKRGGVLDMILLSSTGAEGLDLKNVRHIHIMEPYWNWGRIKQIIARGVRNDSHKALDEGEKDVTPYIYLAVPPDTERLPNGEFAPTTDTELYDESITNQLVIESFHEALREVSIECLVNGEDYCRSCNPTNQPLFTNDVTRDIRAFDPCKEVKETQVKAEEIIVDGDKFYYMLDPSSIYDYKIFIYDDNINGYRPMKESDPRYAKIIDAINESREKK